MTRYVLLLRGVNVGTKNSLPMLELRSMLRQVGCSDVQTYVQSGNAVFGTKLGTAELTKAIEHALERYMGRPIATTLRTCTQMKAIVEANPFANVATTPSNLCVTLLSTAPSKPEVAPLHAQDWAPELFKVAGTCHVELTYADGTVYTTDVEFTGQWRACGSDPHGCGEQFDPIGLPTEPGGYLDVLAVGDACVDGGNGDAHPEDGATE